MHAARWTLPLVRAAAPLCAWPVVRYIEASRNRLFPSGTPLSAAQAAELAGYFEAPDLERVRLVDLNRAVLPSPPLAATARRIGFAVPDPALVEARAPLSPSLLFHEMVHVAQFRMLGVTGFSRLYVHGFLATRSYRDIPLERIAFDLEERYLQGMLTTSVETELERWMEEHRF